MAFRKRLIVTGSTIALFGCGRSILGDPFGQDSNATEGTGSGGNDEVGVDPVDPTSDPTGRPPDPPGPAPIPVPVPRPGPPLLIDAQVVDAYTLELFFSEPIAATAGIDPTKFRLSAATARNPRYGDGTSYYDLGRWNGEERCYSECYGETYGDSDGYDGYCEDWCYTPAGPPVRVAAIDNGAISDRVWLRLDQPMTPSLCKHLAEKPRDGWDEAALLVHYSNNGPGITDLDGESLDAIAEHWALLADQTYSYQSGHFANMNPFIPIPCPF